MFDMLFGKEIKEYDVFNAIHGLQIYFRLISSSSNEVITYLGES